MTSSGISDPAIDLDLDLNSDAPAPISQNWQPIETWEPSAQVVMVSSFDQLEVALLETNNLCFPVFRVGRLVSALGIPFLLVSVPRGKCKE